MQQDDEEMTPSPIDQEIVTLARRSAHVDLSVRRLSDDAPPFCFVPCDNGEGVDTLALERLMAAPARKRESLSLTEAESLAEYVNRHKDSGTLIMGDLQTLTFTAILDHHFPNSDAGAGAARWQEHRATLALCRDPDWARWNSLNGAPMSQINFAEFLEDMQHTIVEPDAARIVEVVLQLQTSTDHAFESVVARETGSVTLNYRERTEQVSGQMKLPTQIEICVAPFRSARPITLLARLRYRVSGGSVSFSYHLLRPDRVEEEAFRQVRDRIEALTEIRPLLG